MTGIPEYRGLANRDVRPLKGASPSAQGDGRFVVSVEDMRRGFTMSMTGGPGEAGAPEAAEGAGEAPAPGQASGTSPQEAGGEARSPLRGQPHVPKSWLRAQNGNGLSEEEKVAKLQKIRKSAQDYEGLLMAEMIKQMRQKPMAKTPGSDTFSEIAEKPFTAALTAAGGLGLADKIVEDVAAQEGLSGTLADHPEVMGPNWRQRIAPSRLYKPVTLGGPAGSPSSLRRAPDLARPEAQGIQAVQGPQDRPDPQGPPAAQGGTGPQTARRPRGSHGAQDLQAPQDARFSGPLSPGNLSAGPAGVSGPAGRSPDLAQGQAAGRASAWPAGQGEAAEGLLTLQAPPAEAEQRTEAVDLLAAENPSRARSGNLRGTLRRGPGVRGGAAGTGPAAAQAGGAPPEGPAVTAAAGSQAGQAAPGARARTGSSDGEAAADPAPADSPLTGRAAAAAWARLAFRPERAKASGGGEGLRSDAGPAAREGESAGDAARSLYDGPF